MSDVRVVQCFGVKKRPHKEEKQCRKRYMWIARGASAHKFGRKGAQACPNCGTPPDFTHPYNRYLSGELDDVQAQALMPDFIAKLEKERAEKNSS